MDAVILVGGCAAALCALIAWACRENKPEESAEPEPEVETEFQRCKREAARVRTDSETGESYAYKLVRIPAEAPRGSKEPTIIDPMPRKVRQ